MTWVVQNQLSKVYVPDVVSHKPPSLKYMYQNPTKPTRFDTLILRRFLIHSPSLLFAEKLAAIRLSQKGSFVRQESEG